MADNITLICVNLPIYNDNTTYCGINHIWTPRISKPGSLVACLVPTFFAWVFTAIIIWKIHKPLYKVYKHRVSPESRFKDRSNNDIIMGTFTEDETETKYSLNENETLKKSTHSDGLNFCVSFWASIVPQTIRKAFFMVNIVILTIIKLLWDATDVTIDAYLFYQLEMGQVIDISIYRNATVNNFILAFSVIGCMKILFWLRIIGVGRGSMRTLSEVLTVMSTNSADKKFLDSLKILFLAVTFMFEDGPELLLEYFYVEKYMSKQITWYLLVRDVIMCIIALYSIVISSIWLVSRGLKAHHRISFSKYDCSKFLCGSLTLGGCSLLIGLCHFLRTGGAGYQYVTGKLHQSCFEVSNDVLRQTPFAAGCMREIDYFIVVLCVSAILLSVFSFFTVNNIMRGVYEANVEVKTTFWQKRYYKCW